MAGGAISLKCTGRAKNTAVIIGGANQAEDVVIASLNVGNITFMVSQASPSVPIHLTDGAFIVSALKRKPQ